MAFTTLTDDQFYYGRRQLIDYDKTAQPTYGYDPLTPQDFLDPQEHDVFNHGPRHDADVARLYAILRHHYRVNPVVAVLGGVKLLWDQHDLSQPAPDLAVVSGVDTQDNSRIIFDVAAEGKRPGFVLEVTSPRLAMLDLHEKVAIYAQGGVREYFIVDSGERIDTDQIDYRVVGYTLVDGLYQPIAPDERGRIASAVTRLLFASTATGDGIVVTNIRTGQEVVPDPDTIIHPSAVRAEATFRATAIATQLDFLRNDG